MMGPEIDVGALSQLSSENFRILLRKIPGPKDLIIEGSLMKALEKFAGMGLIKSCGVDKLFKLENKDAGSTCPTRVYFVRPELQVTKYVVEQISSALLPNPNLSFHVIFVPRALQQAQLVLEEEGLYGKISVHEFSWEIIPLDCDLLSLQQPSMFSQIYVNEDLSLLPSIPKSILGIQALFGHIPHRHGVGRNAVTALDQLETLESASPNTKSLKGEISYLLVIDRSVDYATCLLSPLTYESLLDEVFSIVCGMVELDPSKVSLDIPSNQMVVKLQLSSKDKMFEKIRNKHFATIFASLGSYAKQIKHHQSRASTMSIADMKAFVQNNLKELQTQSKAVAIHIGAAEAIQKEKGPLYEMLLSIEMELVLGTGYKDAIVLLEDLMAQSFNIEITLRLLCLISITNQGIFSGDVGRIKSQFLQAYGFHHLLTWEKARSMGLLSVKDSGLVVTREKNSSQTSLPLPNFQLVSKKFNLSRKSLPQAQGTSSTGNCPDGSGSPGYVFNGIYQPFACKIVEDIIKPSTTKSLAEGLKESQIPYRTVSSSQQPSRVFLVYFIGGYTLAEVAAFRLMQATTGFQFIIAGSCNISGKSLVQAVIS